ncbi:hypothetical protein OQA88_4364 [Cercophora sp. LCS_1]
MDRCLLGYAATQPGDRGSAIKRLIDLGAHLTLTDHSPIANADFPWSEEPWDCCSCKNLSNHFAYASSPLEITLNNGRMHNARHLLVHGGCDSIHPSTARGVIRTVFNPDITDDRATEYMYDSQPDVHVFEEDSARYRREIIAYLFNNTPGLSFSDEIEDRKTTFEVLFTSLRESSGIPSSVDTGGRMRDDDAVPVVQDDDAYVLIRNKEVNHMFDLIYDFVKGPLGQNSQEQEDSEAHPGGCYRVIGILQFASDLLELAAESGVIAKDEELAARDKIQQVKDIVQRVW